MLVCKLFACEAAHFDGGYLGLQVSACPSCIEESLTAAGSGTIEKISKVEIREVRKVTSGWSKEADNKADHILCCHYGNLEVNSWSVMQKHFKGRSNTRLAYCGSIQVQEAEPVAELKVKFDIRPLSSIHDTAT